MHAFVHACVRVWWRAATYAYMCALLCVCAWCSSCLSRPRACADVSICARACIFACCACLRACMYAFVFVGVCAVNVCMHVVFVCASVCLGVKMQFMHACIVVRIGV